MNNNTNSSVVKARDHYQTADHLFHTTFPVAKDPKLLLAIVKSISNCLEYALESILLKEGVPVVEGLSKKINAVRSFATKYHLSSSELTFMLRVHEILYHQKQSPMEFKRGDKHIICSDDYGLEVVSVRDVEICLQQTQKIMNLLNKP